MQEFLYLPATQMYRRNAERMMQADRAQKLGGYFLKFQVMDGEPSYTGTWTRFVNSEQKDLSQTEAELAAEAITEWLERSPLSAYASQAAPSGEV